MIIAIIIGASLLGAGLLALATWGFACEAVARGGDDHWNHDLSAVLSAEIDARYRSLIEPERRTRLLASASR